MNDKLGKKALSKQELAIKLGYTSSTQLFRQINSCNVLLFKLKEADYNKNAKLITPKQVNIICKHFCFDDDDVK